MCPWNKYFIENNRSESQWLLCIDLIRNSSFTKSKWMSCIVERFVYKILSDFSILLMNFEFFMWFSEFVNNLSYRCRSFLEFPKKTYQVQSYNRVTHCIISHIHRNIRDNIIQYELVSKKNIFSKISQRMDRLVFIVLT